MINPLSFREDIKKRNHWHICDGSIPLCGAEYSATEWHIPDEPFLKINLCLDCWEYLAVAFPQLRKGHPCINQEVGTIERGAVVTGISIGKL